MGDMLRIRQPPFGAEDGQRLARALSHPFSMPDAVRRPEIQNWTTKNERTL
jgi:hypothetical protein